MEASAHRGLLEGLGKSRNQMVDLLETIVNIDSFSRDKEGVDATGKILSSFLDSAGYRVKSLSSSPELGDQIIARRTGSGRGRIVFLGHMDTVFLPGTVKERPFRVEGERGYGPGVADMKGGLVVIAFAARALADIDGAPDIDVLFTPDEEIGSPSSHEIIRRYCEGATAVFNAEPGRPGGEVVTGRRGSAHMEIKVKGKPAHSGTEIEKGISAIGELCHKTVALHESTDMKEDITFNVGVIEGGSNTNTVAESASARLHVTFPSMVKAEKALARAGEVVEKSYVQGTSSTLTGGISFWPVERTPAIAGLLETVKQAGAMVGLDIKDVYARGAADSGIPATMGVPTICGMGTVGWNYHTPDEYIEMKSLVERAQLLALSALLTAGKC